MREPDSGQQFLYDDCVQDVAISSSEGMTDDVWTTRDAQILAEPEDVLTEVWSYLAKH